MPVMSIKIRTADAIYIYAKKPRVYIILKVPPSIGFFKSQRSCNNII